MDDRLQDRRTRPIFIHSSIDDMTGLTPNDMRVYMHIARRADNGTGAAWPSYQSIGDHCFASVSANAATRKSFARAAIDNLIANGLIEKHSRHADNGGQQSNVYVLVDPPCLISTPRAYSAPPVLNKHQRISNEGYPMKDDDYARVISYLDTNGVSLAGIVSERYKDLIAEYGVDVVLDGMKRANEYEKLDSYTYVLNCIKTANASRKKGKGKATKTFTQEEQDFLKEMGW